MRWVALLTIGIVIAGFNGAIDIILRLWFSPGLAGDYGWTILITFFVVSIVIALASQVYKYRRESTPLQRKQTRLIVIVLLVQLSPILLGTLFLTEERPWLAVVNLNLNTLIPLLLPLAIAAAVLRHGLWDMDLIIRRTLVYGALTALLLTIYVGSIVLLQTIFTAVSGQQSAVAIVISTLIIAALFNPMRHRIQEFIDRRFFRRKYDAAQTLEQFAVTARDEVDLDNLTAELVRVVEETVQPERVTLWLKEKSKT
jgi:hypothetical protein